MMFGGGVLVLLFYGILESDGIWMKEKTWVFMR